MKNIWPDPKSGKVFYRSRRGGKLVLTQLPDLPHDHPDFIAAWAAAKKGVDPPKVDPASLAASWRAFMASPAARLWSHTYHAKIDRHGKAICAKAGHLKASRIKPEHIRADMDAASVPADRLRAWRAWGAWAADRRLIPVDPAASVKPPKAVKTDGHPPWTEEDIARYRARWPIGSANRALMELAHWTGARASDLVRLGPQMIGRDGVMEYRQKKTGEPADVPWSCPLPYFAAHMNADRQMMLDAIAPFSGHLCFVPARDGKPRSVKAVVTLFQKTCKAAGIAVSCHGLRKSRAIALIEGGATPHDAMAWTGHETVKELVRYARKYNRRKAVMGTAPEQVLDVAPSQNGCSDDNAMKMR